jgi:hypothetical protein
LAKQAEQVLLIHTELLLQMQAWRVGSKMKLAEAHWQVVEVFTFPV